jgi:hypothetical protein
MKRSLSSTLTRTVNFGHAITITDPLLGEQTYVPDQSTAYVEFNLSHGWPVETADHTGIHPQVVANSFQSLRNKVFNLGHLMRNYSPETTPRDRILGAVAAVSFPGAPAGGWRVDYAREAAPGIRAVAVMFKAAEDVEGILQTYARGTTPWGHEWTVSMENLHDLSRCGFLVENYEGKAAYYLESTPEDLRALGRVYVPYAEATPELQDCLNNARDDERDGDSSTRVCRKYRGQQTTLLIGGLNGTIHYSGVGLTPIGKEDAANVARMLAGARLVTAEAMPEYLAPLRRLLAVADTFEKK